MIGTERTVTDGRAVPPVARAAVDAARHGREPRWWLVPVALVAGAFVGAGTQILQGVLPAGWGVLANSGVMWALTAFAVGTLMPTVRWAAMVGAIELVVASITYYVAVDWFEGTTSDPRSATIWAVAGIVAGGGFGVVGHWFTHRPAWRYPALSVVTGVLIGEGIHLVWLVENPDLRIAGLVELTVAVALAAVCLVRSARTAARSAPLVVAVTSVGAAAATMAATRVVDAAFMLS